ncbi:MAG: putative porin [Bacteroidales bacterium]
MKKWLIYLWLILTFSSVAKAQHEGIERHFSNWTLNYSPDSIDSGYRKDTLLESFHLYEKFYNQSIHGGMLAGNNGQAFLSYDYFARPPLPKFVFKHAYSSYFSHSDDMVYFNARKPFTLFSFNSGPNAYEDVKGTISLNANPFFNAGLQYHSVKTEGAFINSGTKNKDFKLWQSYTGKRYQNHFNFIINKLQTQQFGGIAEDTAYENGTRIDNLTVNLTDASTELNNQSLFFAHEYRFGKTYSDTIYREEDTVLQFHYRGPVSIYQDVQIEQTRRMYSDIPTPFYDNIFRDSTNTFDSVALTTGIHQIGMQFFHYNDSVQDSHAFVGVISEVNRFHLPTGDKLTQSHFLKLFLSNDNKAHYAINTEAQYGISGRRQKDFTSYIQFTWKIDSMQHISISNNMRNEAALYFHEYYSSNHYQWDQNFINEKSIKTDLKFRHKKHHFNLRAHHVFLQNPVYIGTNGIPAQYDDNGHIYGAGAGKTFHMGSFGLKTDVLYQHTGMDSIIHFPKLLGYTGLFFEHDLFDHNMRLRVGIDGRYIHQHKSYIFIPATGFFVLTSETLAKNLMTDAYISFKVKRFRAFVRYTNIGGNLVGNAAWTMLHYPQRPSAINFGFSWEFYD